MNALERVRIYCLAGTLVLLSSSASSQNDAGTAKAGPQTLERRDGQHDFDFEIGTWKTHVSRLLHPLTGSTTWVEYDGTTVVRKVWNGRATWWNWKPIARSVISKV
jgi:hypothetical protein